MFLVISFFITIVYKRSEKKLQERKDKAFSKRKKVSGHPNRLEWLFGPPVVFQIFLFFIFFLSSIYIFFYFFFRFFYKVHVIFLLFLFFLLLFLFLFFFFIFIIIFIFSYELLYSVVYLVSNQKIGLGR